MKHLKHIYETDSWATPNRLGGDHVGNVEEFLKEYQRIVNNGPGVSVYYRQVIQLARRLNLSRNDLDEILSKDIMVKGLLTKSFDIYRKDYLNQ